MSSYITYLYILCFLSLPLLAAFVYHQNPRARLNRYFTLGALALLTWLLTLFLYDRQPEGPLLLALGRLNFASSAVAVLLAYLFVAEMAGSALRHPKLLALETTLLVSLTLLTPLVDVSELVLSGGRVTIFGPLFPWHIAHLVLYPGAAVVLAFRYRHTASRQSRAQLLIVSAGILATTAVAVTTDLLLPYVFRDFAFQDVGALSTILFLAALAYAITAQHLFDIRIFIRRTLVFTLLLAFVLSVYGVTVLFLSAAVLGQTPDRTSFALQVAAVLVIAASFDPLRRLLERKTDRFLFHKEHEREAVLISLATKLASVVVLDEALDAILETLNESLHPQTSALFVFEQAEPGTLSVKRLRQTGSRGSARLLSLCQEPVLSYFQQHPTVLQSQAIAATSGTSTDREIASQVAMELKARDLAVAVPLSADSTLLGLLAIGAKRSDEAYDADDLKLLDGVRGQAVSAIQKAVLYEADQVKGEFVSVAAHELLTPIAAVQGYMSMILDEHMGEVDSQARGYLQKAYPSLQRLQLLVKDLLSVSRLESGHVSVKLQTFDLSPLIRSVVDQLEPTARQKHLTLRFEPPAGPLPQVIADPGRLTEVLINLVGNAIKYTREGSVTINVEARGGRRAELTVEIADTGLGMSADAQKKLFGKFYRVATPETADIQGTGLGLYITKRLVEKMGGSIDVESREGQGSVFWVSLPASAATDKSSPMQQQNAEAVNSRHLLYHPAALRTAVQEEVDPAKAPGSVAETL